MEKIKKEIKEDKKMFFGIFNRMLKRDFSGNTGVAIKNSFWQFSSTLVSKAGAILFTIILARVLLPELFGLYSLALSTILIFSSFADLGVSQTLIKFVSSSKDAKKSKAYFSYLLNIKVFLSLISAIILFSSSKLIAINYYSKPISLALMLGAFYILCSGIPGMIEGLFIAKNNFKPSFIRELIFQISRIIFVPLLVIYFIKFNLDEITIASIFFSLSISYLISFVYLFFIARKKIEILKEQTSYLDSSEKNSINKFILALSATTLSGMFFGYIDILILGRFVEAEFIGYYRAAFSLITSATPLITFSSALFPLFSKLSGEQLKRGFEKTKKITLFFGIPSFLFTFFFSNLIVNIIFGEEYFLSSTILKLFSILLILSPLISIFSSYLISQNKAKKVAFIFIFTTALNIILNFIFIFSLISYGDLAAVYGATIATIFSNIIYLFIILKR